MRKLVPAVLATLALAATFAGAQDPPEQHAFTLSWQANTNINSTFSVHSLLTFDGQTPQSSVCGQSPEGYNVWCGEVVHYSGSFDFNFPTVLLSGCAEGVSHSTTVPTASRRRTVTDYLTFSCADNNGNNWSVQTTVTTYQYQSAQR